MLNTGLEKTTVHLIERVRLMLEEFKKSTLDFEASRSMASRAEYKDMGNIYFFDFLEHLTYATMLAYRHLVVKTNDYIDELIKYELRLSIV